MISAVILTKNEEENIIDCIDSVSFCDEIIIIDDNSIDRTRELSRSHGAKIFKRALSGDFASQRNFGLTKAKGDWVLFLDADERITPALAVEIQKKVQEYSWEGYRVNRQDYMWGKALTHGETSCVSLVRLAKKTAGKWCGRVHEVWDIRGKVGVFENDIAHNPHPTITDFLSEINFYSTLRAQELYSQGVKVSFLTIIAYPKLKFIQNYFLRRGFQDGVEGLIMACMMSFHSFLVRGKLYLLNHHGKAA